MCFVGDIQNREGNPSCCVSIRHWSAVWLNSSDTIRSLNNLKDTRKCDQHMMIIWPYVNQSFHLVTTPQLSIISKCMLFVCPTFTHNAPCFAFTPQTNHTRVHLVANQAPPFACWERELSRKEDSRCLQHDFTDTGHGAETVCGVLQRQGLILQKKNTTLSLCVWTILKTLSGMTETSSVRKQTSFPFVCKTVLTSVTKFVVALLSVFSMGVASA